MDGKVKAERKKNPREGANPLSILTFTFTLPMFWVGFRKDLEITDLYRPLKEHTSNYLGKKISRIWEKEYQKYETQKLLNEEQSSSDKKYDVKKKLKEPSLTKVLIKCFGGQLLLYGIILAVLEIFFRSLQPLFLGLLIRHYRRAKLPTHTLFFSGLYNSSEPRVHVNEDETEPLSPPESSSSSTQ